eukprot:1393955-Amorphochlora_amoeboformis.AAC.1
MMSHLFLPRWRPNTNPFDALTSGLGLAILLGFMLGFVLRLGLGAWPLGAWPRILGSELFGLLSFVRLVVVVRLDGVVVVDLNG